MSVEDVEDRVVSFGIGSVSIASFQDVGVEAVFLHHIPVLSLLFSLAAIWHVEELANTTHVTLTGFNL